MSTDDPAASPASLISLGDYERAAGAVLDPAALGYFADGAADELVTAAPWLAGRS